ncbi:MAG: polysialyltransferase family glycosyltransferase [Pseudomonadota bacterium]|nr:polysialyltransferase family glycosyltransferase [Pseudomonadota bacterium]
MGTTAIYFVASPLQLLAAQQIARTHEAGSRQVLIWYQPGVGPQVRASDWDASSYMPWPRREPLPGWFGRHRRLLANVDLVAALIGRCDTLHLHSAVFDTEAINYFLRALPARCGARTVRGRILPDGLISIRRYPLSPIRRVSSWFRKLRRLASPELDYWLFSGDRIGSDAPFCDRIYVLSDWPHEYDPAKVVVLAPLCQRAAVDAGSELPSRALVIGQPLVGAGLMGAADRDTVATQIEQWLVSRGIAQVDYKGHPKDPHRELCRPGYRVLDLDEPLEVWLGHTPYRAVVGVRSTALLFARQLCDPKTEVVAFGWEHTRFKSAQERADMRSVFDNVGVAQP